MTFSEQLETAIANKDDAKVETLINASPVDARDVLQKVLDKARDHEARRRAELQMLKAQSYSTANFNDRIIYEEAAADYRMWQRGNVGFQKVVGRWMLYAQSVQSAKKRANHEAVMQHNDVTWGARVRALENRVAALELLVTGEIDE